MTRNFRDDGVSKGRSDNTPFQAWRVHVVIVLVSSTIPDGDDGREEVVVVLTVIPFANSVDATVLATARTSLILLLPAFLLMVEEWQNKKSYERMSGNPRYDAPSK